MNVGVSTADEAEITLLIKNHFEGMRWTRDTSPGWERFSSDFLPGASLFPDSPEYQKKIRRARTPKEAKSLGRTREHPIRPGWNALRDDVMRRAVSAKFGAHPELAAGLKETQGEELIENAPRDFYWGCGHTGDGKNRLGEILMETRAAYNVNETEEESA